MKKLLTILCLVLLVSCSNEVPDDKIVIRGGLFYEVNSTTPFTGSSVEHHSNGQLKSRTNYRDGKYYGTWEEWDKTGQLIEKTYFKNNRTVSSELYHPNGQLEWRENWKDGKEDGLWESYYQNGQLKEKRNYKDGVLDGILEVYQENGQSETRRNYKNGKKEGHWETFNKIGQLTERENYKDGYKNGLQEMFYGGLLMSQDCYKEGVKTDMSYCEN